jgi:hypothetical protein
LKISSMENISWILLSLGRGPTLHCSQFSLYSIWVWASTLVVNIWSNSGTSNLKLHSPLLKLSMVVVTLKAGLHIQQCCWQYCPRLFCFFSTKTFFQFFNALVLSNIASFIARLKACANRPLAKWPDYKTNHKKGTKWIMCLWSACAILVRQILNLFLCVVNTRQVYFMANSTIFSCYLFMSTTRCPWKDKV